MHLDFLRTILELMLGRTFFQEKSFAPGMMEIISATSTDDFKRLIDYMINNKYICD